MDDFDYKQAFLDIVELINGGGAIYCEDVPQHYLRQYYTDTEQFDMVECMDEEE
jgi:hypothetical protein